MSTPQHPQFSRPGAIDLSSLVDKQRATTAGGAPSAGGGGAGGGGRYVVDVTEATFDETMRLSMNHLIVAEFHSARVQGGAELSATLARLTEAADGRWLLARIDVETEARIAQALGIQSVPMVVGVLGGQLAPLFQGVVPADQVEAYLGELTKAAVANGITGRAEPVGPAPEPETDDETDEPERDPRFAAADDAVEAGDYARAEQEFDALVQADPRDEEAIAGRAMVGLLARAAALDPEETLAAADAAPADVDAQLAAADVELLTGTPDRGFTRLVALVRRTAGDERNTVRLRLLDLFHTQAGDDPAVLKARRDLMSALY